MGLAAPSTSIPASAVRCTMHPASLGVAWSWMKKPPAAPATTATPARLGLAWPPTSIAAILPAEMAVLATRPPALPVKKSPLPEEVIWHSSIRGWAWSWTVMPMLQPCTTTLWMLGVDC